MKELVAFFAALMFLTTGGVAIAEELSASGGSKDPVALKVEEKEALQRLARNPKDAFAMVKLGYVRERQGKIDEAIRLYRQSVKIDPINADGTWQEFYLQYSVRHDLKKAKSLARQVRDRKKTWWCLWYYLGKIAFDESDFKESSRCMRIAMIRDGTISAAPLALRGVCPRLGTPFERPLRSTLVTRMPGQISAMPVSSWEIKNAHVMQ